MTSEQVETSAKIIIKLAELRIKASLLGSISEGPVVTCYRFKPESSTRVSELENLGSDLAVALGVEDVVCKRLPGESAVAIFVPNKKRQFVDFKDCVANLTKVQNDPSKSARVPLLFGVNHLGEFRIEDLAELPHLLVAGSTGSGKSTLVSAILAAIVYGTTPSSVLLCLSDTKNVEFGFFESAPALWKPTATSIYGTMELMDFLIDEMEIRLKKLAKAQLRNIFEFNNSAEESLPYIVFVIDELADILGDKTRESKGPSLGKIAEDKLSKIVQKSRAAGVYVIASTQRPSVNIVAGSIKANFPARLSFRLPSETDSRTVLGTGGAEHLLSKGDCLFVSPRSSTVERLHAPWASISDLRAAVEASKFRE